MTSNMAHVRRFAAALFALLVLSVLGPVAPAGAHTDFESSDPADGSLVDGPVDEISLVFTGDAEPIGDGFAVLGPDGVLVEPVEVSSIDNRTWILRFEPALSAGEVGVRWNVKAPDAHPIDGAFSFTISSPVTTTSTTTTAMPARSTTTSPPRSTTTTTLVSAATSTSTTTSTAPPSGPPEPAPRVAMDDFLAADTTPAGAGFVATAGRMVGLFGAVLAIGSAAFAARVLRGNWSDISFVIRCLRWCGGIVMAGALIETLSQATTEGGAWGAAVSPSTLGSVLGSTFGLAVGLRAIGGLLLVVGIADSRTTAHTADDQTTDHRRWRPGSPVGLIGLAAIAVSFVFDGHTVTEGNRLLTAFADIAHVVAAGVWAGGVVMLAAITWRRHRRHEPSASLDLAIRFSVVAAAALAVAGIAGLMLSVVILDSLSDVWTTGWGRLLLAKTAVVAVAAAAGGFNHFVLIPRMASDPLSGSPQHEGAATVTFRLVISIEALALAVVIGLTAVLVGSG